MKKDAARAVEQNGNFQPDEKEIRFRNSVSGLKKKGGLDLSGVLKQKGGPASRAYNGTFKRRDTD